MLAAAAPSQPDHHVVVDDGELSATGRNDLSCREALTLLATSGREDSDRLREMRRDRRQAQRVKWTAPVAQEFLGGETLNGLSRRHDVSRNLFRIWVAKYEVGAFDDEFQAADLLQQYEARIAALKRLVGR